MPVNHSQAQARWGILSLADQYGPTRVLSAVLAELPPKQLLQIAEVLNDQAKQEGWQAPAISPEHTDFLLP